MGLRKLPKEVKTSEILTGAEITLLSTVDHLPEDADLEAFAQEPEVSAILEAFDDDDKNRLIELHKLARNFIEEGELIVGKRSKKIIITKPAGHITPIEGYVDQKIVGR